MARRTAQQDVDPLSIRAIHAHTSARLRDLWKTQIVGAVIVAIVGFACAWVVSGFSARVWSQVTNAVVFPVAAVVLWLIGSGLWHYWRAPVRLAREHVGGVNDELVSARTTIDELRAAAENPAVVPFMTGPSPWPRTQLEAALAESVTAADDIERERPIRGAATYIDAVPRWAGQTADALRRANAGDLEVAFRQGGVQPPHTVDQYGEYMAEKTQLLEDTLAHLRSDEQA